MALANILLWLFPQHDTSLASPAPESEWISGGEWREVRGSAIEPIEGGSAWPAVRGPR